MTVEDYNNAVDIHADGLYRFIMKNVKVEDTARDIVQDTFEKLWRKLEQVNAEKAKSYLFTTAYHTLIDNIRKNSRLGEIESVNMNRYFHNEQYSDLQEILTRALEKLSPVQRSVLMLRDYEGYSYMEIAEITNLSETQVKVYIYRARIYLKEYIGNLEKVI